MLKLRYSNKFKKDYKLIKKRGYNIELLKNVIQRLVSEETLEEKYCDHFLSGKYSGFKECHIEPDWLLIYQIDKEELVLTASRTGTHSDLF